MLFRITYAGPYDAVDVPIAGGLVATFARGETRELPADLAERLLEQADWTNPDAPDAPTPTPAPAEVAPDAADLDNDDDEPADAGEGE